MTLLERLYSDLLMAERQIRHGDNNLAQLTLESCSNTVRSLMNEKAKERGNIARLELVKK